MDPLKFVKENLWDFFGSLVKKTTSIILLWVPPISIFNQKYKNLGLKISTSYVVYSQIWLNLPSDHHRFFYNFLCMIATMIVSNFNTKKTLGITHQQRVKWSSISNIKIHMPIE